jgi:putative restriction endonuclease
MSGRVFMVPATPGRYDRTVASSVTPSTHTNPPDPLPEEGVRLWGARAGGDRDALLESMESGDLLLFFQGDQYVGIGTVGMTFEDEDGWVSRTYWNGVPATFIYTVDDFDKVAVPREVVHDLFEYDADHEPHGLTRVDTDRVSMSLAAVRTAVLEASS